VSLLHVQKISKETSSNPEKEVKGMKREREREDCVDVTGNMLPCGE
jgi:hypothetical protein